MKNINSEKVHCEKLMNSVKYEIQSIKKYILTYIYYNRIIPISDSSDRFFGLNRSFFKNYLFLFNYFIFNGLYFEIVQLITLN